MRTTLLGILNITPDSFSPGTAYYERVLPAVDRIMTMVEDGAHIIDLGAEAMCPGSQRISPHEEQERLSIVLDPLTEKREKLGMDFKISIDTRNPSTAEWAIHHGADIINDVSACAEAEMKEVLARHTQVPYIFMHNLGTPPDKNTVMPRNQDIVAGISLWGRRKIQELAQAGIAEQRVIFDPGIAFGKTAQQSLDLIHRAEEFHALGIPLCYGHSRKTYVAPYENLPVPKRDELTAGFSQHLAHAGVQYLRVHDVKTNAMTLRHGADVILHDNWYADFSAGLTRRSAKRDIEV